MKRIYATVLALAFANISFADSGVVYKYKPSKLAVPFNANVLIPVLAAAETTALREPIEKDGLLLMPTSADLPMSAANGLALFSGVVEHRLSYLRMKQDELQLVVQPQLSGSGYKMPIKHMAIYQVTTQKTADLIEYRVQGGKIVDERPWNEKLAIYESPVISQENVDAFFTNVSVMYKGKIQYPDCKMLQEKVKARIPNFYWADNMLDRQVSFMEKSPYRFSVKLGKKNRVDFAIDPVGQNGDCNTFIRSFASSVDPNGFDFDEKIEEAQRLIEAIAKDQSIDLSSIEVLEPPKPVTKKQGS